MNTDNYSVRELRRPSRIVDGFHRTAGLVNWADGEGIPYDAIQVRVLDVTGYDEDVIATAAVSGKKQEDALCELYDASA